MDKVTRTFKKLALALLKFSSKREHPKKRQERAQNAPRTHQNTQKTRRGPAEGLAAEGEGWRRGTEKVWGAYGALR